MSSEKKARRAPTKYKDFEGEAEDLVSSVLDDVERAESLRILHAVESGSRSWGFASPDSDYDVRFVYVRRLEDYLTIKPKRKDTIEWVVDETLDVCGWDVTKYLQLVRKGNIHAFEWGGSPCVYRSAPEWDGIWQAAQPYFSCKTAVNAYRGIAKSTHGEFLQGERVRYKKYLYALRPLLACKFIEEQGARPPVRFSELVEKAADPELVPAIELLLERKATMNEGDEGPRIPEVDAFIDAALARYGEVGASMPKDGCKDWAPLEDLFHALVLSS